MLFRMFGAVRDGWSARVSRDLPPCYVFGKAPKFEKHDQYVRMAVISNLQSGCLAISAIACIGRVKAAISMGATICCLVIEGN